MEERPRGTPGPQASEGPGDRRPSTTKWKRSPDTAGWADNTRHLSLNKFSLDPHMDRSRRGANSTRKVEAGSLLPPFSGDKPEWLLRSYRGLVAFAGVLGCYWLYLLLVVPLVEPPGVEHQAQGISAQEAAQAEERFQQYRSRLLPLFPEGTWHLGKTKIIETEDVIVLLEEYERPDELHLRVWPCAGIVSVVTEEDGQTIRSAMIIEAPEGALLEFDAPVDLRRGQIRRPTRIQLEGIVRLRQYVRGARQEDLLAVETRSVEVDEKSITSTEEVQLRFGPHFGKGRGLKLVLQESAKSPSLANSTGVATAVEHVEVSRVDRLHLVLPTRRKNPAKAIPPGLEQNLIFELACDGPFRFDPKELRASFERNVRAWRPGPGATDELRCEELILWLAGGESPHDSAAQSIRNQSTEENGTLAGDPLARPDGENQGGLPSSEGTSREPTSTAQGNTHEVAGPEAFAGWQIRRVQMRGGPAVIRAPLWQFAFEGNFLDYDLATGQYFLGGEGRTIVRYGGVHIQAANLRGHLPFENLGTGWNAAEAELAGPGSLSHTLREDLPPQIVAQWQHRLLIRPHEGRQLLSLINGAEVTWEGVGTLSARELHLWLLPPPQRENSANFPEGVDPLESLPKPRPSRSPSQSEEAFVHIGGLQPERLLAKGNVVIDSRQAHVSTDELRVIFEIEPGLPPNAGMRGLPAATQAYRSPHCIPPRNPHGRELWKDREVSYADWPGFSPGDWHRSGRWVLCSFQANTASGSDAEALPSGEAAGSPAFLPPAPVANAPEATSAESPSAGVGRFEITAGLLQIRLRPAPQGVSCSEAFLEGNVQLVESLPPEQVVAGVRPALLTGDSVYLADPGTPYWSVLVTGRPGHVEGRGLTLTGPRIVVNAASNRLWLDQGGRMELWIPCEQLGRNPPPTHLPLVVRWGRSLLFDGQLARFEGGVRAEFDQAELETRDLEVALASPVRFSGFSHPAGVQLQEVRCQGPATLRRKLAEVPEGQAPPPPTELLEVTDLAVVWPTGQVWGRGPGRVIVRTSSQLPLGGAPPAGQPLSTSPDTSPGSKPLLAAGPNPQPGEGLSPRESLLVLRFAQSLEGNLWQRRVTLAGHVRGLYLAEWPWSWVPDPDSGADPPAGAVRISCGKITAIELAMPGHPPSWELAAEENVWFEGQGFTGKAPRVTYAQGKDLLVLEGTARTPAELYRQDRPGEKPLAHSATRLLFWPGTKKLVIEGLQTLQVP